MTRPALGVALAAAMMLSGGAAVAFPDATPWDQDCQQCHTEQLPMTGNLQLSGVPRQARPGGTYRLTVTLLHNDMRRAGMRLLVEGCGGETGRLLTTDRALETEGAKARTTYSGTTLPRGMSMQSWHLEWRAPEKVAANCTLTFDLRANAANDDLSPLGDVIYRSEQRVTLTPGG